MNNARLATSLRIGRILFTIIVIAAVTYFIGKTMLRNWENIQTYDVSPNGYSIAGLLCFVLSVIITGLSWGRILERLGGKPVRHTDAIRVQTASWLLKYVPGQIGSFVSKVGWGTKNGFTKKDITISFMYENIFLLTSSLITTLPIMAVLFFDRLGANTGKFLPILIAIPMFIVVTKPVFYRLINFALKLTKKKPLEPHYFLDFKELMIQQLAFLVPRILIGAGFVLICMSVVPVSPSQYLGLGATYILAGIIGILALFVPSGIGVREGIIILFASAYFPVETATLLALLSRFYATLADIILALIYVGLNRRSKKS
jgi:hypothetical protein